MMDCPDIALDPGILWDQPTLTEVSRDFRVREMLTVNNLPCSNHLELEHAVGPQ